MESESSIFHCTAVYKEDGIFLLGLLQRNRILQKGTCPLASFGYDSPLLCSLTVAWVFLIAQNTIACRLPPGVEHVLWIYRIWDREAGKCGPLGRKFRVKSWLSSGWQILGKSA